MCYFIVLKLRSIFRIVSYTIEYDVRESVLDNHGKVFERLLGVELQSIQANMT